MDKKNLGYRKVPVQYQEKLLVLFCLRDIGYIRCFCVLITGDLAYQWRKREEIILGLTLFLIGE